MITLEWAILFGTCSVGFGFTWLIAKIVGKRKDATFFGLFSWVLSWMSIYILARLI